MKQLWEFGYAIRSLQARMRFGELSRAPLRFSRLEWKFEGAECHWIARQPDPWDADIPEHIRMTQESIQALKDAIIVRELLFLALPGVDRARLCVYRVSPHEPCELIIAGDVTREKELVPKVVSVVMRAKLLGFRFCMDNGVLEALRGDNELMEAGAYK
ncbi:MAG TPA: hypothetical protein VN517_08080 [Terriglobales bacterium]|jgi:hypothetical protein|nr:hypothetical protein [Terriglobales bacterium]